MEIFLLLLILLIVAPSLFVAVLVPAILLLLVLIPIHLLLHSVTTLVYAPRSLFKIATSARVRRNHALEHATVNVLEERYGKLNLAGYATQDGFKLSGAMVMPPEVVYEAAQEGLKRLQKGEKGLAIHRRCGTSRLMTNLVFSLLFLGLLVYLRYFNFLAIIAALIFAQVLGAVLGDLAQRWLTTSTDVQDLYIEGLDVELQSANPFMALILPRRFSFRTARYAAFETRASTRDRDRTKHLPAPDDESPSQE
jgi:hypothetical protein